MEEGKQTLQAGRARGSCSALKLRSSTLWTAGLAFCMQQPFSAQMNSGPASLLFPLRKTRTWTDTRFGWSVESSGRTITNKRSVVRRRKKP